MEKITKLILMLSLFLWQLLICWVMRSKKFLICAPWLLVFTPLRCIVESFHNPASWSL